MRILVMCIFTCMPVCIGSRSFLDGEPVDFAGELSAVNGIYLQMLLIVRVPRRWSWSWFFLEGMFLFRVYTSGLVGTQPHLLLAATTRQPRA